MAYKNSLRKYRLKRKMTQERLAYWIDEHQSDISKYERGKKQMTEETIKEMCQALNCTPTRLLKESR